ncbi:MAG: hypothetical protein ACKO25_14000, partial [Cyanobium sp.]
MAGSFRHRTALGLALCLAIGGLSGAGLSRADGAWAAEAPSPPGDGPTATGELQLNAAERTRFQRSAEEADALAATPPADAASTPAASPWAGTLELYGFLPLKTTNRTTIEGFTAEADLSLGLLTDISYVNLQKQAAIERTRDRFRIGDG